MSRLRPEARHHARRALNYLVEAYDADDEVALNDGYLALGGLTESVLLLNSPDHVGVRIRMERGGHFHVEARYEEGPWLPMLHRISQATLARLVGCISAIDQDKHMGHPPRKQQEGDR